MGFIVVKLRKTIDPECFHVASEFAKWWNRSNIFLNVILDGFLMATPRLIATFFPENCSLYLDEKEQIHGWIAGQCWIGIEIPSREQMWKTATPTSEWSVKRPKGFTSRTGWAGVEVSRGKVLIISGKELPKEVLETNSQQKAQQQKCSSLVFPFLPCSTRLYNPTPFYSSLHFVFSKLCTLEVSQLYKLPLKSHFNPRSNRVSMTPMEIWVFLNGWRTSILTTTSTSWCERSQTPRRTVDIRVNSARPEEKIGVAACNCFLELKISLVLWGAKIHGIKVLFSFAKSGMRNRERSIFRNGLHIKIPQIYFRWKVNETSQDESLAKTHFQAEKLTFPRKRVKKADRLCQLAKTTNNNTTSVVFGWPRWRMARRAVTGWKL